MSSDSTQVASRLADVAARAIRRECSSFGSRFDPRFYPRIHIRAHDDDGDGSDGNSSEQESQSQSAEQHMNKYFVKFSRPVSICGVGVPKPPGPIDVQIGIRVGAASGEYAGWFSLSHTGAGGDTSDDDDNNNAGSASAQEAHSWQRFTDATADILRQVEAALPQSNYLGFNPASQDMVINVAEEEEGRAEGSNDDDNNNNNDDTSENNADEAATKTATTGAGAGGGGGGASSEEQQRRICYKITINGRGTSGYGTFTPRTQQWSSLRHRHKRRAREPEPVFQGQTSDLLSENWFASVSAEAGQ